MCIGMSEGVKQAEVCKGFAPLKRAEAPWTPQNVLQRPRPKCECALPPLGMHYIYLGDHSWYGRVELATRISSYTTVGVSADVDNKDHGRSITPLSVCVVQ